MANQSKYLNKKIYVAGHSGMVGSAITNELKKRGFKNLILKEYPGLDLIRQNEVEKFFEKERPEIVIIAAAKVGGILANNTYRAEFLYDNLMIEASLIHNSQKFGVEKLIFLGSSCIYPKLAPQPLKEEYLLSGYLEFTNEPYAIAKIAGIKLCENYYRQYGANFYSVMPTNLYGPNDNFDLETSHVLPALIRKFHEAKYKGQKEVLIWGTGNPLREFLFVEDIADAILFLMESVDARDLYEKGISHINVGTGKDISINELAKMIADITDFDGKIANDISKPDGTPRKLLDVSRINSLGWKYKTELKDGIIQTYDFFMNKYLQMGS
jgi:GDP-L-fucose synthase